jgi:hypothetical protein
MGNRKHTPPPPWALIVFACASVVLPPARGALVLEGGVEYTSCAINDGFGMCWGDNSDGQAVVAPLRWQQVGANSAAVRAGGPPREPA